KGALGALLVDPKSREAVDGLVAAMDDFRRSGSNLEAITRRIADGEGSLGALVNDDGLYDDVRALIGRARRNVILRTVIRRTIDKNEKEAPPRAPVPAESARKRTE